MFSLIFLIFSITFGYLMSTLVIGGWFILLWVPLAYIVGLLSTVLVFILLIFITYPLSIKSKIKNYMWRSAAYFFCVYLFNIHIRIINKEKRPKTGKAVFFSNHKSYLDPLIMVQAINRPVSFTPKSSLYKIPILKQVMESMGSMPIHRGNDRKTAQELVKAIKNIEDGHAMGVFPEGGRKDRDTDQVMATRAGAFKLATKPKAMIVPVTINGISRIKNRAPFLPTRITVIIHDPITYEEYKDMNTQAIGDMVTNIINSGLIE